MSVFKSYKIDGANLQLEEYMYWGLQPNQPDAVQVWNLINIDRTSLEIHKLEQLIAYQEDADYEQVSVGSRVKLSISTYFDSGSYTFTCDMIETYKRPYNVEELNSFLMRHMESYQQQEEAFSKQNQLLDELKRFVEFSIDRKSRIINETPDNSSRSRLKAEHQLEILNELQTKINNSKFK